jgi:hypothetical protein
LIKGEDIFKHIKTQRIKGWGRLTRMEDVKRVEKITDWNLIGIRTKGQKK